MISRPATNQPVTGDVTVGLNGIFLSPKNDNLGIDNVGTVYVLIQFRFCGVF